MTATQHSVIPPAHFSRPGLDMDRLRLGWGRTLHRLRMTRRWWFCEHKSYQPVFVIASARSGSNLLIDYFRRLPSVQSHWELLCDAAPEGPRRAKLPKQNALQHLRRSMQLFDAPIRGCKLLMHQLDNCGIGLNDLEATFPTAKYIVLYRESLAAQFISLKTAQLTNQWSLLEGQKRISARVDIDPSELRRYCQKTKEFYRDLLAHSAIRDRGIYLSYETLSSSPLSCFRDMICPFVGVTIRECESAHRKQNVSSYEEQISNYREIAGLLASPLCYLTFESQPRLRLVREAA